MTVLQRFVLVLWFGAGLGSCGIGSADENSAELQIRLLEQKFISAIPARGRGMEALLDSDFYYNTSAGSRLGREMLLDYLAESGMQVLDIQHESLAVDAMNDHALAEGVVRVRVAIDGTTHEQRSRFLHLWRLRPDGWKLSARQVTTISE